MPTDTHLVVEWAPLSKVDRAGPGLQLLSKPEREHAHGEGRRVLLVIQFNEPLRVRCEQTVMYLRRKGDALLYLSV